MDEDGLLAAGVPGVQLTWMDARIGAHVVTPRIGKPVEVQALWLNALRIGALWAPRWADVLELGLSSFNKRFWNEDAGCLYDVIDADHERGKMDAQLRPNQVLAVGGLPLSVLEGARARRVVETVERTLLTPMGLRSLAPRSPGYCPQYRGGPEQRDGAYHQGTVWPWLLGPFVEAWVRVRGDTATARTQARSRFLAPLMDHLATSGLGHVSEVADGEAPHAPGGCPFQAWSIGELLRLDRVVLAEQVQVEPQVREQARRKVTV
jgi:glycogen debranching enzyme